MAKLTSKEKIIKIISDLTRISIDNLGDNVLIEDELGIDSIMAIEIISKIEKELKIRVDERKLANIKTVGDFVDVVMAK